MGLWGQKPPFISTRYNGVHLNQAILGECIPILMGQNRLSSKLLWYGDFTSAKAKQPGGSGLAKGGTEYVYTASIIALLCEGVCQNLLSVWDSTGKFVVQSIPESYTITSPYTYLVNNQALYAQDQGVGVAQTYSVTANDYGSPGSVTLAGTQQVPLTLVSGTPSTGEYSIDGAGTYTFAAADTGNVVTITYAFYRYNNIVDQLTVIPFVATFGSSYVVVVDNQPYWYQDDGVSYYPSGVPLTATTDNPPTVAGQYNPNNGSYVFSAGDAGQGVVISYGYNNPNTDNNAPNTLNMTFIAGAQGQAPWSYMTTNHPGEALGYTQLCYVASSGLYLGYTPEVPSYSYEILGPFAFGAGIVDACPSDCIEAILSNPQFGIGFDPDFIDESLQEICRAFWVANSFFISPVIDSQKTAASVIGDWCEAGQVASFWSEGVMKFVPYGTTTAVGNGAQYTPPTTPVYSFADIDYIVDKQEAPIKVMRSAWQDAYNKVEIQWSVRVNDYNRDVCAEQDDAAIEQFGLRLEQPKDYTFICTLTAVQFSANMRVQRNVHIRNTYTFRVSSNFIWLDPMDIIEINDSILGLVATAARIIKMVDDPQKGITLTCEDFPWATGNPSLYPKQVTIPSSILSIGQQSPGNTNLLVIEVPSRPSLYAGDILYIFATGNTPNWGGCTVWKALGTASFTITNISADGTNVTLTGTNNGLSGGAIVTLFGLTIETELNGFTLTIGTVSGTSLVAPYSGTISSHLETGAAWSMTDFAIFGTVSTPARTGILARAIPAYLSTSYVSIVSDNFTRADENPLNPINWTVPSWGSFQPLQIISDTCCGTTSTDNSFEVYSSVPIPYDQYAEITIGTIDAGDTLAVWCRVDPTTTSGYQALIGGIGAGSIITLYAGAVVLGTFVGLVSASDVILISAVGTTISVLQNGTTIITAIDSTYSYGYGGAEVTFNGGSASETYITDFEAGEVVQTPSANPDAFNQPIIVMDNPDGTLESVSPEAAAQPYPVTLSAFISPTQNEFFSYQDVTIDTGSTYLLDTLYRGLLGTPASAWEFEVSATDDFVRADGAIGGNWTQVAGTGSLSILSDNVYCSAGSVPAIYYQNIPITADQYSQLTITAVGSNASDWLGVAVRISGMATCYAYFTKGDGTRWLYSIVNGIATILLGSASPDATSPGDVLQIVAVGTSIICYYNGGQDIQVTDASITGGGSPGLFGNYGGDSDLQGNNWSAGPGDVATFVRLDEASLTYQYDPSLVGSTIFLAATSVNPYGNQAQSLADVEIYPVYLAGSGPGVADLNTGALNTTGPAWTSYRPLSNPLTSFDAGSSATIDIIAFFMQLAGYGSVAYNSGSITGLEYSTLYYVYFDQAPPLGDLLPLGGTVTYVATTTKEVAMTGTFRFFVGSIYTASVGGPETIGNNDGGNGAQGGMTSTFQFTTVTVNAATGGATITNPDNCINGNIADYATFAASTANDSISCNFSGLPQLTQAYQTFTLKAFLSVPTNTVTGDPSGDVFDIFFHIYVPGHPVIRLEHLVEISQGVTSGLTLFEVSFPMNSYQFGEIYRGGVEASVQLDSSQSGSVIVQLNQIWLEATS